MLILAGALALVGTAAYGWSLTPGNNEKRPALGAVPAPSVLAASGKCVVSYAVREDNGSRFKASVTIANRANKAIKNWNLLFVMQGTQTVSGGGKIDLDQQGTMVTVTSEQTLSAQKAVTLDITGRYSGNNPPPMAFKLGPDDCETYVSPKPGEPSRPVQRLSNGQVRLGPEVKTPVPGISIGPGGVVVPIPGPVVVSSAAPIGSSPAPANSSPGPGTGQGPGPGGEGPPDCVATPNDPRCEAPPSAPSLPPPSVEPSTSHPEPPGGGSVPTEEPDEGDTDTFPGGGAGTTP